VSTITLLARSSGGPPYDVTFADHEGRLRITCTCKGGVSNLLCKHRIELIEGDVSRLHVKPLDAEWLLVRSLVEEYGLSKIVKELRLADMEFEEAGERVKNLRRNFAHGLDRGVQRKK